MAEGMGNVAAKSEMSDLMLSSSMDWTVKLWYPKNADKHEPINTFESSQEYIYDVQWSPVHPTVFAQVDGDGYLDVWDMNKDWDTPIAHKAAFESKGAGGRDLDEAKELSTLRWSRDGRRIAVGDSEGFVSIWQADKELYLPK